MTTTQVRVFSIGAEHAYPVSRFFGEVKRVIDDTRAVANIHDVPVYELSMFIPPTASKVFNLTTGTREIFGLSTRIIVEPGLACTESICRITMAWPNDD